MPVVVLWSTPRSRSTAFYRSMAERGDMVTLHEPFWETMAFAETDVAGRIVRSPAALLTWLRHETADITVFLKDTTDHRFEAVLADEHFLAEAHHAFLIRNPDEIVSSYYALWPEMRIDEVGLENMYELFTAVGSVGGHEPVVIESDDLVAQPAATMAAFCAATNLPFVPEALRWEPGDRPEWRRSANWHVDAASSSAFAPVARTYTTTVANSDTLARYAAHHRRFYEQLHARRLRIPPL